MFKIILFVLLLTCVSCNTTDKLSTAKAKRTTKLGFTWRELFSEMRESLTNISGQLSAVVGLDDTGKHIVNKLVANITQLESILGKVDESASVATLGSAFTDIANCLLVVFITEQELHNLLLLKRPLFSANYTEPNVDNPVTIALQAVVKALSKLNDSYGAIFFTMAHVRDAKLKKVPILMQIAQLTMMIKMMDSSDMEIRQLQHQLSETERVMAYCTGQQANQMVELRTILERRLAKLNKSN